MPKTSPLAKDIRKVMGAEKVILTPIEGGTHVEALRNDGARLKFELYDDGWVNCSHLSSPGHGWLSAANRLVTEVLTPKYGCKYVIMDVENVNGDWARETLLKYAPYRPLERGRYRWDTV